MTEHTVTVQLTHTYVASLEPVFVFCLVSPADQQPVGNPHQTITNYTFFCRLCSRQICFACIESTMFSQVAMLQGASSSSALFLQTAMQRQRYVMLGAQQPYLLHWIVQLKQASQHQIPVYDLLTGRE